MSLRRRSPLPSGGGKPQTLKEYVSSQYYRTQLKFTDNGHPYIALDKTRIIMWMSYWPVSALWTLINDPLHRLYNFIYNRLESVYTAIAAHVMRKFVVVKTPSVEPADGDFR